MKKILLFVGMIPALCAGLLCACATTKTDIKQLEGKWTITAVNSRKRGEDSNGRTSLFRI